MAGGVDQLTPVVRSIVEVGWVLLDIMGRLKCIPSLAVMSVRRKRARKKKRKPKVDATVALNVPHFNTELLFLGTVGPPDFKTLENPFLEQPFLETKILEAVDANLLILSICFASLCS